MAGALCLALFACEQEQVSPDVTLLNSKQSELNLQPEKSQKERQFKASLTYEGNSIAGQSCEVRPWSDDSVPIELNLDGKASQMGRVTGIHNGCMQMPSGTSVGTTGSLVSSNGQEIWYKCDHLKRWYVDEERNMVIYRGTATIVGGAGRFEGATGSFVILVSQDLSQPEGIYVGEADLDGLISY